MVVMAMAVTPHKFAANGAVISQAKIPLVRIPRGRGANNESDREIERDVREELIREELKWHPDLDAEDIAESVKTPR